MPSRTREYFYILTISGTSATGGPAQKQFAGKLVANPGETELDLYRRAYEFNNIPFNGAGVATIFWHIAEHKPLL